MNTAPSGDAMTVRYHRDDAAAALKRENIRRPIAWKIHPADAARAAAEGKHCQTRRCREPISIVTWRWFWSADAGRILVAEHFRCDEHGEEFATRYRIEIEPPPPEPSRGRGARGTEGGAR